MQEHARGNGRGCSRGRGTNEREEGVEQREGSREEAISSEIVQGGEGSSAIRGKEKKKCRQ